MSIDSSSNYGEWKAKSYWAFFALPRPMSTAHQETAASAAYRFSLPWCPGSLVVRSLFIFFARFQQKNSFLDRVVLH
jgi:hypothetical protein